MKRRRLRVLHVVHELHYGGLECLVAEMVRLIDHDRFESHILTLSNFGRFADGLEPFAQLHRFRSVPRLSMLWPRGLIRKIRAIAPDVAHIHGAWYKASLAARHAHVPRLVYTEWGRHHPDPWIARFLDGLAALIERHGLRDAARLAGWRRDVENVHAAFDVFTLPSWSEGTSVALLEAMSTGVC